jgi:hypothetical protein
MAAPVSIETVETTGKAVRAASSTSSLVVSSEAALTLAERIAPVARGLKFLAGKAPIISGGMAALKTASGIKKALAKGNLRQAWNEGLTGAAQTIVSTVGGGVAGDIVREGLRLEVVELGGEANAPQKSDSRETIEWALGLIRGKHEEKPAPVKAQPPPPPPAPPTRIEDLVALDGRFNAVSKPGLGTPRPRRSSAPAAGLSLG